MPRPPGVRGARRGNALAATVALLCFGACARTAPGGGDARSGAAAARAATPGAPPAPRRLTLIATAEVRGTPEPCGCQSDPLGDVARVASLLEAARRDGGAALLVDAGGLRYSTEPLAEERRPQAELEAALLERAWETEGAVVALGDEDLRFGGAKVPPGRRLASNVAGLDLAPHPWLRDVGGFRVGVFAVLDPALAVPAGVTVSDPIAAAKQAVAELRKGGAAVIVALAHLPRPSAKRLAREVPGISVVVVGDDVGDGARPEQVGETLVVQPADEARRVARVELVAAADGRISTRLHEGAEAQKTQLARATACAAELDGELAHLRAAPDADPSYVAARERERARLDEDRRRLEGAADAPPEPPYALAELVPVTRRIPRDERLAAMMKKLDADVGQANRAAAEKVPVPAAAPGEARYVGGEVCADCHRHEEASALWQRTVHAHAWETLVRADKQWSYDCIKCHVTGYGERGGSAMAHVDGLTDVQCEVCHGPGSLHAARPAKVRVPTPSPDRRRCEACHTPEHSDTFQYEAYLRDVLGPGHGARRRAALGDGPTGHELRTAALARAAATPPPPAPAAPSPAPAPQAR